MSEERLRQYELEAEAAYLLVCLSMMNRATKENNQPDHAQKEG